MYYKEVLLNLKKKLEDDGHELYIITTIREPLDFNHSRINFLKNHCDWQGTVDKYIHNPYHHNIQCKYFATANRVIAQVL